MNDLALLALPLVFVVVTLSHCCSTRCSLQLIPYDAVICTNIIQLWAVRTKPSCIQSSSDQSENFAGIIFTNVLDTIKIAEPLQNMRKNDFGIIMLHYF